MPTHSQVGLLDLGLVAAANTNTSQPTCAVNPPAESAFLNQDSRL